jgi:hypothetical protein
MSATPTPKAAAAAATPDIASPIGTAAMTGSVV